MRYFKCVSYVMRDMSYMACDVIWYDVICICILYLSIYLASQLSIYLSIYVYIILYLKNVSGYNDRTFLDKGGKGAQLTPSQQLECHPSQLLLSRSRNRQHLGNKLRRNSTCVTACGLRLAFASRFMLQDAAGISKVHLLGANRVANFDALSCVDIPNTSFRLS